MTSRYRIPVFASSISINGVRKEASADGKFSPANAYEEAAIIAAGGLLETPAAELNVCTFPVMNVSFAGDIDMGVLWLTGPLVFKALPGGSRKATAVATIVAQGIAGATLTFQGMTRANGSADFANVGTQGVNGTPHSVVMWNEGPISYWSISLPSDGTLIPYMAPPVAPTIGALTAGDGYVTVNFTPAATGVPATSFVALLSNGNSVASMSSPIIVPSGDGVAVTATVYGVNANGTSVASAASNAVTPNNLSAPGAPTITSVLGGGGQVRVVFTAPANNGNSPITRYNVSASPSGNTAELDQAGSGQVVVSSPYGIAQTYRITATNAVGTSAASAVSAAETINLNAGRFFALTGVTESGTGPYSYTGAASGSYTNNTASYCYQALGNGQDGEFIASIGSTGGSNGARIYVTNAGISATPYYAQLGVGFEVNTFYAIGAGGAIIGSAAGAANGGMVKIKRDGAGLGAGMATYTMWYWTGSAWALLATVANDDSGPCNLCAGFQNIGVLTAIQQGG